MRTTSRALIIGGTGQIGRAASAELSAAGFEVTIAHRGERAALDGTRGRRVILDREDTDALRKAAAGADVVLDTVAYTPAHARQLLALDVGSLIVISTASVYRGANGSYLDIAESEETFPDFPVPVSEDWPTVDNGEETYSPLKAGMERVLIAGPTPVSILRPAAIHGPGSPFLREWFFIKRALDGRRKVVLAYDGLSRFSTSSTANIAALVVACANRPGTRALNVVDEEGLTVAEIGSEVFGVMNHEAEIVTFSGAPRDGLGDNPWAVPKPFVLSMERARQAVGYAPAASYSESIRPAIDWIVREATEAAARGLTWEEAFPRMVERYGAAGWFPYESEDAFSSEMPRTPA